MGRCPGHNCRDAGKFPLLQSHLYFLWLTRLLQNCGICYKGASAAGGCSAQQSEPDGSPCLRSRGLSTPYSSPRQRDIDLRIFLQDREAEPRFIGATGTTSASRGGFGGGGGGMPGFNHGYAGGPPGGGGGGGRQIYVSNVCLLCSKFPSGEAIN